MLNYVIKKFIISQINKLLLQYKDNVPKVGNTLNSWIARLELVISIFKRTLTRLDDGKMDRGELDDTIEDIEKAIKEW